MSTQPSSYADDNLDAAITDGETLSRSIGESFDVVVVGSGAAGSVAAHFLTEAGLSVAIVEEGPWIKTRDLKTDVDSLFRRAMRLKGMQVLQGRAYVPMLQGRCVGGSTLVNSAIAWRVPEDVVDDWGARFGLAGHITMHGLEQHFEALERDLGAREVDPTVLGENNRLFVESAQKAGISAAPMHRYDRGCTGSGMCLTGCPTAAKQGMSVTYVPWALKKGAHLFTSCRVDHVEIRGDRAACVVARTESGQIVRLAARHAVVIAASTVQSPNILRRSGVRAKALGKHFQVHPGVGLAGLFDRPINMAFGATQGAESIHFRRSDRFKLETISLPPDLAAARVPGVGRELSERLAQLPNVAVWATQVRAEAEGTVTEGWGGLDRVKYTMTENDMRTTRKGLSVLARLMFDAGAKEVWPGVFGVPSVLRTRDDLRLLEEAPLDPRCYGFIATHLMGAARMGPDPKTSVCDPTFQVHGTNGLYVVDSSVFPTNLGVNPQHTIMALSRLAAVGIAERALGRRAA